MRKSLSAIRNICIVILLLAFLPGFSVAQVDTAKTVKAKVKTKHTSHRKTKHKKKVVVHKHASEDDKKLEEIKAEKNKLKK